MLDTVFGQPLSRVDGQLKVTGRATYSAEHDFSGMVHAVLVCSTISRGRVASIRTAKAEAQPGVVRVVTDFSGARLQFDTSQVNFFGQPIAVAIAGTLEQAQYAAALVKVEYLPVPAALCMDDQPTAPSTVFPDYQRGDPNAALNTAHSVIDTTFTIKRENHNPMELPATVARWEDGKLTLWDKTQWVQGAANSIAAALRIDAKNVRVITPFVGGAFGSAGITGSGDSATAAWPHQILTALVAKQVARPVKLVMTRAQMFSGIGYRPASWQRIQIGSDPHGRISVINHSARTENARYASFEDNIVELPRVMYASPSMGSEYRVVPLDVHLPTSMRGPGRVTGAFALECGLDILAHELGLDPIELRQRNDVSNDQVTDRPFATRRLSECYERGAQRFGWLQRRKRPASRREGNWLLGMGMAAVGYHNNRRAASALARITDDGSAVVSSATGDMGPGTYTAMSQIAADVLGLPIERVSFQLGDSVLATAPIHAGSLTAASVGSAVFGACRSVLDSVVRMAIVDPASPLHGAPASGVSVADGRLFVSDDPGRGETYREILTRRGRRSVASEHEWQLGDVDSRYASFAFGAVFAEVAVDASLGIVRLRRMHAVYDVGRVINPKLARSQAIGAMVMGVGMTLLEHTQTDQRDGRLVNANLSDYLVPVNADIPVLEAEFLDGEEPLVTPTGVKGLGELVIVGVPAAIANAVFNATGKRITDLPITVEQLL